MIKDYRKKAGLTQQELADLLGIPLNTIKKWDSGKMNPPEWVEKLVIERLKKLQKTEVSKMKEVVDVYGRKVVVDWGNKKLYSFNNQKREIRYNAEIVEDGAGTGFYTEFVEKGTVEDIEERLGSWNNIIKLAYASFVGYDADKNDPDRKIWESVVAYVKENEQDFFTKKGDFRQDSVIDVVKIVKKANS